MICSISDLRSSYLSYLKLNYRINACLLIFLSIFWKHSPVSTLELTSKFYCRIFKYQTESKFLGPINNYCKSTPSQPLRTAELNSHLLYATLHWPFISGKISIEPGFKNPALSKVLATYRSESFKYSTKQIFSVRSYSGFLVHGCLLVLNWKCSPNYIRPPGNQLFVYYNMRLFD